MIKEEDDIFPRAAAAPEVHAIGQPLEHLSLEELGLRIEALRAEIGRLELARAAKQESRASAAAFFKSGR